MGISVLIRINWNILDKSVPFSTTLSLSLSEVDLMSCTVVNSSKFDQWILLIMLLLDENEYGPTNKSCKISVKVKVNVFLAGSSFSSSFDRSHL